MEVTVASSERVNKTAAGIITDHIAMKVETSPIGARQVAHHVYEGQPIWSSHPPPTYTQIYVSQFGKRGNYAGNSVSSRL